MLVFPLVKVCWNHC